MAWYRAGTVTVTNGSPTVTGAGTDFVANAQIGHAFLGPDGRAYEVAQVVSAAALTLAGVYLGGSAGGQGYAIMPTQSYMRDLALGAAELLNSFAAVRDGIGQGLFGDGTVAAPGLRFAGDADTGLRRVNTNALSLVTGGVDRVVIDSIGRMGINGFPSFAIDVFSAGGPYVARFTNTAVGGDEYSVLLVGQKEAGSPIGYIGTGGSATANAAFRSGFVVGTQTAHHLAFSTSDVERARIDTAGRFLLGTTTDYGINCHTIQRGVDEGERILNVTSAQAGSVQFFGGKNSGWSGVASGIKVYGNSTTGRSINAAGTVNASGADYAEYMTKADGCGTIAPGDVCGVDINGKLTQKWTDAISFVVKSTDPAYVGGDVWGQSIGERPEDPGIEPTEPAAPPVGPASDTDDDLAAWRDAISAYPAQLAAYRAAHSAWEAARTAYTTALAAWDAALEAERQKVDRIAFCGQVPVNVTGIFAVGDYLIAAATGAGIGATAVPAADITFEQYRHRIGRVWAVRDGRAWVDVQHG